MVEGKWIPRKPTWKLCKRAAEAARRISNAADLFTKEERDMFVIIAENFEEAAGRIMASTKYGRHPKFWRRTPVGPRQPKDK